MPHLTRRVRARDAGLRELPNHYAAIPSVVSAATLTLPDDEDLVELTGTATITAITASSRIREVTLRVPAGESPSFSTATGIQPQIVVPAAQSGPTTIRLLWDGSAWSLIHRHHSDQWHVVGASGEPAFQNSWVNYGGTFYGASFRRSPDGTHLNTRGFVKNGTAFTTIYTLPAGYFSTVGDQNDDTTSASGFGALQILAASGNFKHIAGSNAAINLMSIWPITD